MLQLRRFEDKRAIACPRLSPLNPPSVSIALATYNGEKYIRRQLQSLASQTYVPAELVITDDGSRDRTLSIARDFAKTAPFPVHVHRNTKRLGFRGNFMKAASLCRSELIAFCDQDDVWYDHKIASCIEPFEDSEMVLVHHNADVVDANGVKKDSLDRYSTAPMALPLSLKMTDAIPGLTQIFRRELLRYSTLWPHSLDQRFPGEPMAHDQWFLFIASVLGKIGYVNRPLLAYYQHGNNTFGHATETTSNRARFAFHNPAKRIPDRIDALNRRAEILDRIADETDDAKQKSRARQGATMYRRLSSLNAVRESIYRSASPLRRSAALATLFLRDGYRSAWGLGRRALVKDALVGVPLGPRLRG